MVSFSRARMRFWFFRARTPRSLMPDGQMRPLLALRANIQWSEVIFD